MTGFSAVIGSWKTIAIERPRISRQPAPARRRGSSRRRTSIVPAGDARGRAAAGRRSRAAPSSCRSPTRPRARAPRRGATAERRAVARRAERPGASANSTRRSRTSSSGVGHSGRRRSARPSASSERPSAVITTAMPGNRRELASRVVRYVWPSRDHPAPVGRRRLHAETEVAERDDREDVEHDVRHREHDGLRDHVGQQVAAQDARRRQTRPPGRRARTRWRLATSTSPRTIRV